MSVGIILAKLALFALQVYFWIIIISVVLSWLIAFDVVNVRNPQAANLVQLLGRATEPVYGRLRRYIPAIGGIDLTPMVIIFGIMILEGLISNLCGCHL